MLVSETRKQRVALVSDWFLPRIGGIELHLADLARALAEQDIDVSIITTTHGPSDIPGLNVVRLIGARAPMFDFSVSPFLVQTVLKAFAAGSFDVIHIHASVVSPLAIAAAIAGRRIGLPIVVTFHSMLLRAAGVLSWSDRIWHWTDQPILYSAVSGCVVEQVRPALGEREIIVLPNGIDLGAWADRPVRADPGETPIVFTTAMRLAPKKRPIALLDDFQIARKIASTYDRRLELRIAGDGPLRSKIEKIIGNSGLGDSVRILGSLTRRELVAQYAESDVFVMPSTRESFGLAALEARASGLPVVAMEHTGAEEFLVHGETALLSRDDRSFAANMAKLATDDALRAKLSGRDAGLARFDWPGVAAQHLAAYERARQLLTDWSADASTAAASPA